jgi:hypothetical protein
MDRRRATKVLLTVRRTTVEAMSRKDEASWAAAHELADHA